MARVSQKDIFNVYSIFDDGVAQWLTQCREKKEISKYSYFTLCRWRYYRERYI